MSQKGPGGNSFIRAPSQANLSPKNCGGGKFKKESGSYSWSASMFCVGWFREKSRGWNPQSASVIYDLLFSRKGGLVNTRYSIFCMAKVLVFNLSTGVSS